MKKVLLVQGAQSIADVPRLETLAGEAEIRFATTEDELNQALPGAEVMLGWNFRADSLRAAWSSADSLQWIHWAGAGVDAAMFPELVQSRVQLTNAQGVFDQAMAEWVLGMMICFAKQIPQSLQYQARSEWHYRQTEMIAGKRALVVGIGSIGRSIGRLLKVCGVEVEAMGRSARGNDADFGQVYAIDDLRQRLPLADYVICIPPLTEQTRNLFGAAEFEAMQPGARFINLGRGALVVEADLIAALENDRIAGAALDVFVNEPLPADSPFWNLPNCLVSPHMSGDYIGFETTMASQFIDNWARYLDAQPLKNLVDKRLGFVPTAAPESAG